MREIIHKVIHKVFNSMFEETLKFYQDFPNVGITFVDIIPYLQDKKIFTELVGEVGKLVTAPSVAAPEARAFLFCAPLLISSEKVTNIIPFRKKGKLPFAGDDLQSIEITKEYGLDNLFFRKSDIAAGQIENGVFRITIIDDVLATGGTAEGIAKALTGTKVKVDGKEYGVEVAEFIFIAELDGLYGRARLEKIAPVHSIAHIK